MPGFLTAAWLRASATTSRSATPPWGWRWRPSTWSRVSAPRPPGGWSSESAPRAGRGSARPSPRWRAWRTAALAQSTASLLPLLLVAGAGNAIGGPAVSALLRREVAVHRQGLAFGAQQSGASLGALLAGLSLPAVAIPFGWRWAFLGGGRARGGRGRAGAARRGVAPTPPSGRDRPPASRACTRSRWPPRWPAPPAWASSPSSCCYAVHSGIGEGAAGLLLGAREPRRHGQPHRARRARSTAAARSRSGRWWPCSRSAWPATCC